MSGKWTSNNDRTKYSYPAGINMMHENGIYAWATSENPGKTIGRVSYARQWGSYGLEDGQYVYEVNEDDARHRHMKKVVIRGLPKEILDFLLESDAYDFRMQRYQSENRDNRNNRVRYVKQRENGKDEDFYRLSPQDLDTYRVWFQDYTDDEDAQLSPDDVPTEVLRGMLSDSPSIRNAQIQDLKEIIQMAQPAFSKEDNDTFIRLFQMVLRGVEIADGEGVQENVVSNRKKRLMKKMAEVFAEVGYIVPTKAELKDENRRKGDLLKSALAARKEQDAYEKEAFIIRKINYGKAGMDYNLPIVEGDEANDALYDCDS